MTIDPIRVIISLALTESIIRFVAVGLCMLAFQVGNH
jgi:hypothetical protein